MRKLSLANLAQSEVKKDEAQKTKGGGCTCTCFCDCQPMFLYDYRYDFRAEFLIMLNR